MLHRLILSLLAGLMLGMPAAQEEALPEALTMDLSSQVALAQQLGTNAYTELDGLYFDFRVEHGQPWTWLPETWVLFKETFTPVVERLARDYPHIGASFLNQLVFEPFALPGEGDLLFDEAADKAWNAVADNLNLAENQRKERTAYGVFLAPDEDSRIWKIHFYDGKSIEGTPYALLDAETGVVMDVGVWPAAIDLVAAFSTMSNQKTAHQALKPGNPRADGKPAFWYGDFAPGYFWEQLDKSPYLGKGIQELEAAFGKEQIFWPLEARALEFLSRQPNYQDYWIAMPGLPGPEDITEEEALAIARERMENSKKITDVLKVRLKPNIGYFFYPNSFNNHGNEWFIQFHDPDHPLKEMLFSVIIDADTGDVVMTLDVDEGNG
ncbi:MAG: PepSY domain-containing protein [Christensenellales bacterium]|jgi:hypothetical protein